MSVISFAPALAAGGTNGNLNGTVVDASSKAPVAGASVVAKSGSGTYSATTDARGFFSILQMNIDSYTLTISAAGHDTVNLQNVIVFGDETDTVGTVSMQASGLKTIAKVTSRSASSAFQPTQTTDTYSVSGQRIQQALGNAYNSNEATLVQSVPGVIATYDSANGPGLSIRGSLGVELGYQYDEVPFSSPFFNANAGQGFINGINGGSGGGLQIVSGAGDATQGNVGGGVINTVVPRGTYPAMRMLTSKSAARTSATRSLLTGRPVRRTAVSRTTCRSRHSRTFRKRFRTTPIRRRWAPSRAVPARSSAIRSNVVTTSSKMPSIASARTTASRFKRWFASRSCKTSRATVA